MAFPFPHPHLYAIVECTMKTFRQVLESGEPLLFDGAMGTELYARGVFINKCFEEANLTMPELVRSVHRDYREAGAEVLTTNSWGAGRFKLARHNLQDRLTEINRAAVTLAREVAQDARYVAASVGPLGPRLEPVGALTADDALDAFCTQIQALAESGADCILLETFGDVREAVLAVQAARAAAPDLPVIASLTIDMDGNPLFGMQLEPAMDLLVEAGADALGLNCSVGPQPMLSAAQRIRQRFPAMPLLIEPNAGLPRQIEGRMIYMSTPEYFATYAKYYLQEGVRMVGGCCGTTPEHIRAMAGAVRQYRAMCTDAAFPAAECRPARTVYVPVG
ncbi:MAG: homocysteine S-methyltransferase family protein, partial [Spirochaetales bacterium]|nr:homocysteine S-methyltransferase family protein [Spirochaetales bacterium]